MKKLLTIVLAAVAMVGVASAQSITLGKPKAQDTGVSAQSVSGTLDNSLFKMVILFDGLDNGELGFMYDVAQLNGFTNRPLRIALAGAKGNDGNDIWFGLALNYDVVKTDSLSLGVALAFPGLNLDGSDISFARGGLQHPVPGFFFSAKVGS